MGNLFDVPEPEPVPVPPTPETPAKTDIADSDALVNARKRASQESSRRGRGSLKIPLAGTGGKSGISISS
jgi:hypothetical protein